jgi:dihydrofolate reductase
MFATAAWARMQGLEGGNEDADSAVVDRIASDGRVGATIMGRNMFSPGRGEWDHTWKGWWGANPPYHHPTFVLTHHPRRPIEMEGGTIFYFVTDGIDSALRKARDAAGSRDVRIGGGAHTIQQFLRAGVVDDLFLHLVPVVLGEGERLLENVRDLQMTPVEVIASPAVTHIRYRIDRQ